MHSKQEEGYQAAGLASAIQTNPSFAQREYRDGITSPSDSMEETIRAQQRVKEEEEEALAIISKDINQTN